MGKEEIVKRVLDYLEMLHCFACPYEEECSPEYPEYLFKCRYIEDWVLNIYNRRLRGAKRGREKT